MPNPRFGGLEGKVPQVGLWAWNPSVGFHTHQDLGQNHQEFEHGKFEVIEISVSIPMLQRSQKSELYNLRYGFLKVMRGFTPYVSRLA